MPHLFVIWGVFFLFSGLLITLVGPLPLPEVPEPKNAKLYYKKIFNEKSNFFDSQALDSLHIPAPPPKPPVKANVKNFVAGEDDRVDVFEEQDNEVWHDDGDEDENEDEDDDENANNGISNSGISKSGISNSGISKSGGQFEVENKVKKSLVEDVTTAKRQSKTIRLSNKKEQSNGKEEEAGIGSREKFGKVLENLKAKFAKSQSQNSNPNIIDLRSGRTGKNDTSNAQVAPADSQGASAGFQTFAVPVFSAKEKVELKNDQKSSFVHPSKTGKDVTNLKVEPGRVLPEVPNSPGQLGTLDATPDKIVVDKYVGSPHDDKAATSEIGNVSYDHHPIGQYENYDSQRVQQQNREKRILETPDGKENGKRKTLQNKCDLRFRPDGTFKILQVADLHISDEGCVDVGNGGVPCNSGNSSDFLRRKWS